MFKDSQRAPKERAVRLPYAGSSQADIMALSRCPCCAYSVTKALVEEYFVEYDALTSRFKATERHFEKVFGQIEAMRGDLARKAQTAFSSEMTQKEAAKLLDLAQEFKESVHDYEDSMGDIACPCCRGVPGLKQAAADMIEASDILRYFFVGSQDSLVYQPFV